MEAVAGLSVAANVFQVVDFSHKLISAVIEYYKFGLPSNIQALDQVVSGLKSANGCLNDVLGAPGCSRSPLPSDQAILDLAHESNSLATELLSKVNFSAKGNAFRSFCNGITTMWNHLQGLVSRFDINDRVGEESHRELLTTIRGLPGTDQSGSTTRDMEEDLWTNDKKNTVAAKTANILHWLRFARMDARRNAISELHRETFEWVYHDAPLQDGNDNAFSRWLRECNGMYWFKGKAGSEMQKTQIGLLRAVLYDILRAEPNLVPIAFPGWLEKFSSSEPILEELKPALSRVLKATSLQGWKVCIFVDGLDEYKGDGINMTDLAEFLRSMSEAPNMKLLVSSRPLQPFEEVFTDLPQLSVHDLTGDDIWRVVTENLETHKRMAFLLQEDGDRATKLIEEISQKSSGVFLWVRLAVKAIKEGLQNHDNFDQLEDRLRELPPELDALFALIIQRIPKRYKQDTFTFLEVARQYQIIKKGQMPWIAFLFATESSKRSTLDVPMADLQGPALAVYMDELRVKLKTRTFGLLEEGQDRVHFLHRTVFEFLHETSNWRDLLNSGPSGFDVNMAIAKGMIVHLKTVDRDLGNLKHDLGYLNHDLVDTMDFFCLAVNTSDETRIKALDEIDRTMVARARSEKIARPEYWPDDCFYPFSTQWERKSTFLAFTITYHCEYYVRHSLEASNWTLPPKEGQPLMHYAIKDDAGSTDLFPDPKIVEMLLKVGANPSERYAGGERHGGVPAWFYAVEQLRYHSVPETGPLSVTSSSYYFALLKVIHLLVTAAAASTPEPGFEKIWPGPKGGSTAKDLLERHLKRICPCKGWDENGSYPPISCESSTTIELKSKVNEIIAILESNSKPRKRERVSKWFARVVGKGS